MHIIIRKRSHRQWDSHIFALTNEFHWPTSTDLVIIGLLQYPVQDTDQIKYRLHFGLFIKHSLPEDHGRLPTIRREKNPFSQGKRGEFV